MISTEESIIRLLIAIVLGGLIGYEREAQSKSAGLRTHILVCLGSCLCMIISVNIAMEYFFRYGYTNSDPGRIAAQVVSGVGFLGAGTILANQKGRSIHGLTTAASIWVVAAVGLVDGAGYLLTAAAATLFVFIVLTLFVRLDKYMRRHSEHTCHIHLVMRNSTGQFRRMTDYFQGHHLALQSFRVLSEEEAADIEVEATLLVSEDLDGGSLMSQLLGLKGVLQAELLDLDEKIKVKEK